MTVTAFPSGTNMVTLWSPGVCSPSRQGHQVLQCLCSRSEVKHQSWLQKRTSTSKGTVQRICSPPNLNRSSRASNDRGPQKQMKCTTLSLVHTWPTFTRSNMPNIVDLVKGLCIVMWQTQQNKNHMAHVHLHQAVHHIRQPMPSSFDKCKLSHWTLNPARSNAPVYPDLVSQSRMKSSAHMCSVSRKLDSCLQMFMARPLSVIASHTR